MKKKRKREKEGERKGRKRGRREELERWREEGRRGIMR